MGEVVCDLGESRNAANTTTYNTKLSRTNKPKSHHKTNTLCPITLVPYNP